MFPFLHNDGSLYFASDGHVGMGGLDIHKSELDENGRYVDAINLKSPINSSADDFGMIVERKSEKGYFSSNRRTWVGEYGVENKSNGSDNIYQFELPPLVLTLQGVITDIKTGAIITEANVKLVGDDSSAVDVTTDNTGSYYFELTPLRSYEIIVSKEGYLSKKVIQTTAELDVNTDIIRNVKLDPMLEDIVLPRIEYDFAKWDLGDTSKLDLDRVYDLMIKYTDIVIQLNSHTDFRGTDSHNLILSQKRADACIQYLISKGIAAERLIANGKGESQPYILEARDAKHSQRGGFFTKKIFKEGDVLTEPYINKLKNKYKETAHQYNRRTTFTIEIKEIEER
jgi:peptidoglycan-associated lipoprotein